MVLFHLNYSLVHIFNNEVLNFSQNFWFYEGRISALLFIFIWGFSFFLAEQKHWAGVLKRYLKISSVLWTIALLISIITYNFFPEQYIRFWIIHFFSISFLLLILFRKLRRYNFLFGILIIVYGFYFIPVIDNQYFYFMGFVYPTFLSADFYPLFPYFWVMLLGYSFAIFMKTWKYLHILEMKKERNRGEDFFIFLWRRSLLIYLIHQPVIIGFLYLLSTMKA